MALAFTQPIAATARDDEDELMLDIDMEVDEGPLMEEDTLEVCMDPELFAKGTDLTSPSGRRRA